MAQVSGILVLNSFMDPENHLVMFMSINNAKFRKPVVPGDQLYLEAEVMSKKSKYFSIKGSAYVNNDLVAEAEFMGAIVDKENQKEK